MGKRSLQHSFLDLRGVTHVPDVVGEDFRARGIPHHLGADDPVVHNEERCIGCCLCATLCPNAAINTMGTKVLKCDLWGGDPECVKFCTTEAIKYLEETAELEQRRHALVDRLRSA